MLRDEQRRVWIAFDDGDLRVIDEERFQAEWKTGRIAPMDVAEGGLVANAGGVAAAEDVTWYNGRPAGVLLGNTGLNMGGMLIYQSHVVQPASFKAVGPKRGSRSGAETTQNVREYGGWHTVFKGDRVDYAARNVKAGTKGAQEEGQHASAIVFGFAWHKGVRGDQGRKFLILYEEDSHIFFIGMCTRWRRRRGDGEDATKFDEDAHDQAATISVELCECMNSDFEVSGPLAILAQDTFTKVENQAKHLPPSLRGQNKAAAAAAAQLKVQAKATAKAKEKQQKDDERKRKAEREEDEVRSKKIKPLPTLLPSKPPKPPKQSKPLKQSKPPSQPKKVEDEEWEEEEEEEEEEDDDDEPPPPKKISRPPKPPPKSPPPKPPPKPIAPAAVPPPPLPRGWKSSFDEDGVIFYYNKDRSKVQYEEPLLASPLVQGSPPPPPPPRVPRVLPQQPQQTQPQPAARLQPPPMHNALKFEPASSSTNQYGDVLPSERRESVRGLNPLEQQRLRQIAALRSQLLHATSEENKLRIAGLLADLELAHDQGWT